MKVYEIIFLVALFLVGTILWTLPIQEDTLPFGEGDAAWHFANGDYVVKTDKVFNELPFYISVWYYGYNQILGPGALAYPPPYHVGYAIFQRIGGERFVPVYILIAISSFIATFAVYLLLRKLYDFPTAVLASVAMLFSYREILVYLWGQRPTIMAFAFTPLILFAFFRYMQTHYKEEPKPIYLYITGILIILQFLVHPQGAILSLLAITVYGVVQSIRKKNFPINKKNILHIFLLALLAGIIIVPFLAIYTGADTGIEFKLQNFNQLTHWFDLESREGYPNTMGGPPLEFYNTDKVYFPFYYVLLWLGILYLLIKREDKDILMLSWLAALYIAIHLDMIGLPFGRVTRMLMGETVLFYAIMAIGVIGITKLFVKEKSKIKMIVVGIVLFGLIFYNGQIAYSTLKGAYDYPLRISNEQYEAAQWIDENLPENAYIYQVGTLTYPKYRFMSMLSHRPSVWQDNSVDHPWINITHVLVDSSDFIRIGETNMLSALTNYEQQFPNWTRIYDQNNIRIYRVTGGPNG